jgi:hypothetical protein
VPNDERCLVRLFSGTPSWGGGCPHAGGLDGEEGFGGRGALEPLMGPMQEVVGEGGLEPSLQVADREGGLETEARGVFQSSPEALEAGRRVEVQGGGEALRDPVAGDRLREGVSLELASEIGDDVLRGAKSASRGLQQARHLACSCPTGGDPKGEGRAGEGVEDGGQVEDLAAQQGRDGGHVHHPGVVDEGGDDGVSRRRRPGARRNGPVPRLPGDPSDRS